MKKLNLLFQVLSVFMSISFFAFASNSLRDELPFTFGICIFFGLFFFEKFKKLERGELLKGGAK